MNLSLQNRLGIIAVLFLFVTDGAHANDLGTNKVENALQLMMVDTGRYYKVEQVSAVYEGQEIVLMPSRFVSTSTLCLVIGNEQSLKRLMIMLDAEEDLLTRYAKVAGKNSEAQKALDDFVSKRRALERGYWENRAALTRKTAEDMADLLSPKNPSTDMQKTGVEVRGPEERSLGPALKNQETE